MARVEVITGPAPRLRWSVEQKRAVVAESLAPGAMVTEIPRRTEICAGQIYRWRREIGVGHGFARRTCHASGWSCRRRLPAPAAVASSSRWARTSPRPWRWCHGSGRWSSPCERSSPSRSLGPRGGTHPGGSRNLRRSQIVDPLRAAVAPHHRQPALRRMGQNLPGPGNDGRCRRPPRSSRHHLRNERRELPPPRRARTQARPWPAAHPRDSHSERLIVAPRQ